MTAIFGRHFQMHFLEYASINFDYDFTDICTKGPINNMQALVQKIRLHAIIRTNDGQVCWRINEKLGLNVLVDIFCLP